MNMEVFTTTVWCIWQLCVQRKRGVWCTKVTTTPNSYKQGIYNQEHIVFRNKALDFLPFDQINNTILLPSPRNIDSFWSQFIKFTNFKIDFVKGNIFMDSFGIGLKDLNLLLQADFLIYRYLFTCFEFIFDSDVKSPYWFGS